jgi:hypothetical protein
MDNAIYSQKSVMIQFPDFIFESLPSFGKLQTAIIAKLHKESV